MEEIHPNLTVRFQFHYYSTHGVCLPNYFPIPSRDPNYMFSVLIITVNTLAFLTIAVSYLIIYRYRKNRNKIIFKTRSYIFLYQITGNVVHAQTTCASATMSNEHCLLFMLYLYWGEQMWLCYFKDTNKLYLITILLNNNFVILFKHKLCTQARTLICFLINEWLMLVVDSIIYHWIFNRSLNSKLLLKHYEKIYKLIYAAFP